MELDGARLEAEYRDNGIGCKTVVLWLVGESGERSCVFAWCEQCEALRGDPEVIEAIVAAFNRRDGVQTSIV